MYNEDEQATRSSTASRRGSYNDGPSSRAAGRPYQPRSSITEENGREDNEYEEAPNDPEESPTNVRPPQRSEDQYIAALRYRFPNRPKTDYSYSRPAGPAGPSPPQAPPLPSTSTTGGAASASRGGAYQSTVRPTTGGTNTSDASEGRTFPRPALRRINPDQQNTYARRVTDDAGATTAPPPPVAPPLPPATYPSRPPGSGPSVRINEPNIERNQSFPSTFNRQPIEPPRPNESIFEKVPPYGGPVSFLGIGTFSQFEHCLHECLERERRQTGINSQIIRQDIRPYDYDYNAASVPYYHGLDPVRVHQFIDYPSQPTATFGLDDIRQINLALSRSGIPLFPHHQYHESYFSPISIPSPFHPGDRHFTGEVVSACRVVDEDPAILASRNGSQAVQNVWSAIRNHRPVSYMSHVSSSRGPYDD